MKVRKYEFLGLELSFDPAIDVGLNQIQYDGTVRDLAIVLSREITGPDIDGEVANRGAESAAEILNLTCNTLIALRLEVLGQDGINIKKELVGNMIGAFLGGLVEVSVVVPVEAEYVQSPMVA